MKNENKPDQVQVNPAQYGYPMVYQQEDEIDLYDLFSSIFSQWKMIAAITFVGTLLAIIYVLVAPRQYEAIVQVARPEMADIKVLSVRGYEAYTPEKIFVKYYEQLRSAEIFKVFLKEKGWYKEQSSDLSEEELFLSLFKTFKTEIIRPKKGKKTDAEPSPRVVTLQLAGKNETDLVNLVNEYTRFVNQAIVKEIEKKGRRNISLEVEAIERKINTLRENAKVKRFFLISKIEEKNLEKIAQLEREKALLIVKADKDKESKIARLKEAYNIAKTMGIKKLTTLDALAAGNKNAKMLVTLGGAANRIEALMGTVYLGSKLETLKNRTNDILFIPEISNINKKIDSIKQDEKLKALKERKSDDPYLESLPDLFKRLDQLKRLTFDFSGVQLYRLDQRALVSDDAVKPKKKLIVAIAFILSGFISLFIVMIVNARNKHKEQTLV